MRTRYPMLHDTAAVIADPLVRNLATVCGNLAHADPANDHPATMLALGAEVVATGPRGERTICRSTTFFVGPFTTALAPGEILTEIRIPRRRPAAAAPTRSWSARWGTSPPPRPAVQVTLAADGTCERGRNRPDQRRADADAGRARAEAFLRGQAAGRRGDRRGGAAGRRGGRARREDRRGSVEYKRDWRAS